MKGHEEIRCRFKLKTMQEAQRKLKNQAQQKNSKESSNEAFAVEHEMSNTLDASMIT